MEKRLVPVAKRNVKGMEIVRLALNSTVLPKDNRTASGITYQTRQEY